MSAWPEIPRVHLTLRCNKHCSYCAVGPVTATFRELTAAEWLDRIQQFPGSWVILSGGEPTLYRDFVRLVQQCPKSCMIYSNFTTPLDPQAFDPRRVRWRATLHTNHPREAEQFCLRVAAFRNGGFDVLTHSAHRLNREVEAVCATYGISLQTVGLQLPPPQIHRPVRCTYGVVLIGPDGRRYHCSSRMSRRDEGAVLPTGAPRTIVCQQAHRCNACDGEHAKRTPIE